MKKRGVGAGRRIRNIAFERLSVHPGHDEKWSATETAEYDAKHEWEENQRRESVARLLGTHIKSLNDTVPNNVRANPGLPLHDAMVTYSDVPRPKPAACLRVWIRCVVF
jgi:hypothetical protein